MYFTWVLLSVKSHYDLNTQFLFQSKTWVDADAACFIFHETRHSGFQYTATQKNKFVYDHMKDVNPNAHTWIGLYRSTKGTVRDH